MEGTRHTAQLMSTSQIRGAFDFFLIEEGSMIRLRFASAQLGAAIISDKVEGVSHVGDE